MMHRVFLPPLLAAMFVTLLRANDRQVLTKDVVIEETVIEDEITEFDRDHWSFQPIVPHHPPTSTLGGVDRTPIDAFVQVQLAKKGLQPSKPAARNVLLRRLTYDLIGLPPTLEDLSSFEQDSSPRAYQRVVDWLLASPAYGERQAQDWLDLARFAETDGFEHDRVRPDAWKYRQWVVDAINDDMPYDHFVRAQLTGDQTGRPQDAIATMFCLAGPDMPDLNEQDLRRHDKLNEITSTIGSSLLGLQMQCAQCHDHKYDPISQADFYRLRGVFESSIGELQRDKPIATLVDFAEPFTPHVYYRGELGNRGPRVDAAPPRVVCDERTLETFDFRHPRQAFCDWLLSDVNPLVSRVIVNRVWQRHFGKGLCENPSDFGVVAGGATHPELLDYLATQLRHGKWSLKRLSREIVMSAVYRQASEPHSEIDPENRWYSHFPRKRLEGELIRDSLLFVGDRMNAEYGGPSVMPPLPTELKQSLLKGQWSESVRQADHHRRSIYIFARRNLRYPIFDVFDRPDAGSSCAVRGRSTTALQSLQMLNGDIVVDASVSLRDRLLRDCNNDQAKMIDTLFLFAFSRHPSSSELIRMKKFLNGEASAVTQSPLPMRLLTLCVAALNANEFVYLD